MAGLRQLSQAQLYPVHALREFSHGVSKRADFALWLRRRLVLPHLHKGPFSSPADDQPGRLEGAECFLHRGYGDAVGADQLALGRQLLARSVVAALNGSLDLGGHLEVRRPVVVRVEVAHGGQITATALAGLSVASRASRSKTAMIADVAGGTGTRNHEAPAGVAAPAGAHIETLGESMQVNGTRMLRVKAVAAMYDVSAATIYRAIEAGHLTALKLGSGRALRIPETALRAYEDARQVSARAPGSTTDAGAGGDCDE